MPRRPNALPPSDPSALYAEAETLLSDMSGVQPVAVRGGLVDAYVDVGRIRHELAAVDEEHIVELGVLFDKERDERKANKTGQLLPILLGDVVAESQFWIADGFHRAEVLRRRGAAAVYSSIRPNCSIGELYDLRILATSSQQSVHFARIANWIDEAWAISPWKDSGISAVEAFMLRSDGPGKLEYNAGRLGVPVRAAQEMLHWVNEKCAQWKLQPSTIQANLIAARAADPQLVQQVRDTRNGGPKAKAAGKGVPVLSSGQLKVIASAVPGLYTLQNIIAGSATLQKLNVLETRRLAAAVKQATDIRDAQRIINSQDWRESNRKPPASAMPARQGATAAPTSVGTASRLVVEAGPSYTGLKQIILDGALTVAGLQLALRMQRGEHDIEVAIPTIQLDDARLQFVRNLLPLLSPLERQVVVLSSCFKKPPAVVAEVLGCTRDQVRAAILSAEKRAPQARASSVMVEHRPSSEDDILSRADQSMDIPDVPGAKIYWNNTHGNRSGFAGDIVACGIQFGKAKIVTVTRPGELTSGQDKCGFLAALGLENSQIGTILHIDEETVKSRMKIVFRNRKVAARIELAKAYFDNGTFHVISAGGAPPFTAAQREIAEHVAAGLSNKQIAHRLCWSERTVITHIGHIFKANDLTSREQVALLLQIMQNSETTA